jgi:hypothetical protein
MPAAGAPASYWVFARAIGRNCVRDHVERRRVGRRAPRTSPSVPGQSTPRSAGRWSANGAHTGPWGDLGATGKAASFSGVNIFRFENGKVAELWNYRDDLGLMQELGAPVYAGAAKST